MSSSQPIYTKNRINFNPVVNFDDVSKTMTNSVNGTYQTVFAVRNLSYTSYQTLFSAPANTDFSIRAAAAFNGSSNMDYTD